MQQYGLRRRVTELLTALLPEVAPAEFIIDRIHHLPKPSHLPEHVPKDVILHIYFQHIKKQLLLKTRGPSILPVPYTDLQLQYSVQTITKALWNHGIKWGYRAKILIYKDDTTHVIDFFVQRIPSVERLEHPYKLNPGWHQISHKSAPRP